MRFFDFPLFEKPHEVLIFYRMLTHLLDNGMEGFYYEPPTVSKNATIEADSGNPNYCPKCHGIVVELSQLEVNMVLRASKRANLVGPRVTMLSENSCKNRIEVRFNAF